LPIDERKTEIGGHDENNFKNKCMDNKNHIIIIFELLMGN